MGKRREAEELLRTLLHLLSEVLKFGKKKTLVNVLPAKWDSRSLRLESAIFSFQFRHRLL